VHQNHRRSHRPKHCQTRRPDWATHRGHVSDDVDRYYEDRFVIPTAHREINEDAYDLRGSCGFTFGNGCSGGTTVINLFGAPKRAKTPLDAPADQQHRV
jgi:hypothetical protein